MPHQPRRVVVTGMGALTPIGNTVEAFWDAMMRSESGAAPITYFDPTPFDTKFACELKGYDPLEDMDRKLARRLDPFCQYALSVAKQAVQDAGLDPAAMPADERRSIGVIFGSGIGGMHIFHEQTANYIHNGPGRMSPFFIPMLIPDMAAGLISMQYGFMGPNYCVVSACATGNNNIGDAFMLIQRGLTDVMLCGGSEGTISELGIGGFNAMKALSTRNDDPAGASRPFDATRDGFVMGEGGGALILEELEHARARGAKIYAEMIGLGMSADAHHMTAPHPEGLGARLAMDRVLKDADIRPEDVDYLNMHGTSTPPGDVAETNAVKQVFGPRAYEMNLSSTKSMTGHLLGAAGAVEAIAAILATVHDVIPPTINFSTPDPQCDLNYTFNEPQKRTVNVAISNAFGFGGHNTAVAFRKFVA
ncbi:MAG TPA: beta-ketoacyl-ACP synthase II [Rhodothermales bacterium]|nr:beta-ketoacyl-ACP synthase II [Rhodothermales bacterium]